MRIKVTLSYDGTNYCGYQKQKNQNTIQKEIEKALKSILKKEVISYGSGRTDGHVHAKGQVFHFDTDLDIDGYHWVKALNSFLPDDIRAINASEVDENFHARYSAISKEYRYYINIGEYDVFLKNYTLHATNLDVSRMREAIKYFIGVHDFTSFSHYVEKKSTIREIYEAKIIENNNILEISFIGNGFLKYMVRIMVGTLIEIGLGKKDPIDITKILEAKERHMAGKTASPNGLFLYRVNY